jgi:hypothetical protein
MNDSQATRNVAATLAVGRPVLMIAEYPVTPARLFGLIQAAGKRNAA